MFRVTDCVADRVRLTIPQATEWQHIGNQIDTAFIFAGADFVNVLGAGYRMFYGAIARLQSCQT
jgi:hypothetical protein